MISSLGGRRLLWVRRRRLGMGQGPLKGTQPLGVGIVAAGIVGCGLGRGVGQLRVGVAAAEDGGGGRWG